MGEMGLYGADADEQPLSDLRVGATLDDEHGDLVLALGQPAGQPGAPAALGWYPHADPALLADGLGVQRPRSAVGEDPGGGPQLLAGGGAVVGLGVGGAGAQPGPAGLDLVPGLLEHLRRCDRLSCGLRRFAVL